MDGVVAELAVDGGIDGQLARGAEKNRIAVGRGLGDGLRAQDAIGAGFVVDVDGLLQRLRHGGGIGARRHVHGLAGGIAHHDAYGMVGIGVLLRLNGGAEVQRGEAEEGARVAAARRSPAGGHAHGLSRPWNCT